MPREKMQRLRVDFEELFGPAYAGQFAEFRDLRELPQHSIERLIAQAGAVGLEARVEAWAATFGIQIAEWHVLDTEGQPLPPPYEDPSALVRAPLPVFNALLLASRGMLRILGSVSRVVLERHRLRKGE